MEEKKRKREEQRQAELARKAAKSGGKVVVAPPEEEGVQIIDKLLMEIREGTTLRSTNRKSMRRTSQLKSEEIKKLQEMASKSEQATSKKLLSVDEKDEKNLEATTGEGLPAQEEVKTPPTLTKSIPPHLAIQTPPDTPDRQNVEFEESPVPKAAVPNVNTETPESNVNTETPESNVNTETPVSNVNTETPVSNVNTETPVSNVSTETPVSNVSTETPVPNINTETPVSNVSTETPVSNVSTETPVSNIGTEVSADIDSQKEKLHTKIDVSKPLRSISSGELVSPSHSERTSSPQPPTIPPVDEQQPKVTISTLGPSPPSSPKPLETPVLNGDSSTAALKHNYLSPSPNSPIPSDTLSDSEILDTPEETMEYIIAKLNKYRLNTGIKISSSVALSMVPLVGLQLKGQIKKKPLSKRKSKKMKKREKRRSTVTGTSGIYTAI